MSQADAPDADSADISVPSDCPLDKLERKRQAQGRDLTVLISSWDLERGQGKTTLALRLAQALDRTDTGITDDRATLSARELTQAHTREPPGASLVFDEAMGDISNRRAMSSVNEAFRELIGMGRVEKKRIFFTSPGLHMVDSDIRAMCDIWILARELGRASMYRVNYNPFGQHVMTDPWGTLRWSADLPGDLQAVYDRMTAEKRRRLRGEGEDGTGYVEASKVEEAAETARREGERQKRDELLREMYHNVDGMTQAELADSVGLSRSRIADILSNGD